MHPGDRGLKLAPPCMIGLQMTYERCLHGLKRGKGPARLPRLWNWAAQLVVGQVNVGDIGEAAWPGGWQTPCQVVAIYLQ